MLAEYTKSMTTRELTEGQFGLIGLPESGYSMKTLAAIKYKQIDHSWLDRFRHGRLFQQHAKVQLIPLLLLPDGSSMQDSTPILEYFQTQFPKPSIHPENPALRFLSEVLEEYGDEWANKLMFQYRWGYTADQRRRSISLAEGAIAGFSSHRIGRYLGRLFAPFIVRRMVPRMAFAGANGNNRPLLVESFANLVDMLEIHLQGRSFLLGERPCFGDFGLWGQMYQAYTDPSCEAILNSRAPHVVSWIERMLSPEKLGNFESLNALVPTLSPIFARELGPRFLAWSDANAIAWQANEPQTHLVMDGRTYFQKTFKYPALTLEVLRQKYESVRKDNELIKFLRSTGCDRYFV